LEFEVDHKYDARRIVKLDEGTCTRGRWHINGIPYTHACAAIYMYTHKHEQYLDGNYMIAKYMQAYEPQVHAMPGPEEWSTADGCDEIMPPIVKVQPGRPRKERRRAPNEPTNPYKISHSGVQGHNYNVCHIPLNLNRKRWNPNSRKTAETSSNIIVICLYSSITKCSVNKFLAHFYVLGTPK